MPIEFRCTNVVGFSAERNAYDRCNQKLRAGDSKAGLSINCPKCSQPVVVPDAAGYGVEADSADDHQEPVGDVPDLVRHDIMEMSFHDAPTSIASTKDKFRCPKCGGPYSADGICQLCQYVEPVQRADREFSQRKLVKPAGFQLWIASLSNDPKVMKFVGLGLFVMSTMFCVVIIAVGILSGSVVGVLAAVVAGFAMVFLINAFTTTRKLAKDPEAGLGLLAPLWNGLLFATRKMNWQGYDSRFANRKIVDLRTSPISDGQLPGVDGIDECQVLDLEGSPITDQGLRHLYGNRHLHCVVLRQTEVTRSGVARLQQAIPRLWIWY